MNIDKAREIATKYHEGQTRWNGDPYITHPERVATKLQELNYPDEVVVAAWLHDVLEDCKPHQLEEAETEIRDAFGWNMLGILNTLKHYEEHSYSEYIARLAPIYVARTVKIYDLIDNLSDLSKGQRRDKYELALLLLRIVKDNIGGNY